MKSISIFPSQWPNGLSAYTTREGSMPPLRFPRIAFRAHSPRPSPCPPPSRSRCAPVSSSPLLPFPLRLTDTLAQFLPDAVGTASGRGWDAVGTWLGRGWDVVGTWLGRGWDVVGTWFGRGWDGVWTWFFLAFLPRHPSGQSATNAPPTGYARRLDRSIPGATSLPPAVQPTGQSRQSRQLPAASSLRAPSLPLTAYSLPITVAATTAPSAASSWPWPGRWSPPASGSALASARPFRGRNPHPGSCSPTRSRSPTPPPGC